MCIRVQYAPRHEISDPWDRDRNLITIPDTLDATVLFTIRGIRGVLQELGVDQDHFGARCWCGEQVRLPPRISQQRKNEVTQMDHKTQARPETRRHAS